MNTTVRKVTPVFGPDTRFEVTPAPAAPFRAVQDTELERLKQRLLRQLLDATVEADLYTPLRRAANDAAALAWSTAWPLLVFPALLEEKAEAARQHAQRQRLIRRRSLKIMAEAA